MQMKKLFEFIFGRLETLVNRTLLEGRFKAFLRYVKHQVAAKNCRITHCFKRGAYKVNFSENGLSDYSVLLPDISFNLIRGIPRETPPYFSSHFIKEGSVVVDAGSFPGDFAVLAAKIVGPRGKVIALEPNAQNRTYLKKVFQLNQVEDRVELLSQALSNETKKVYLSGQDLLSKINSNPVDSGSIENQQAVTTISVDELSAERGLLNDNQSRVVVKMDIEGAELEAVEGAQKALVRGVKFIIASYHVVDGQRTAEILEKKFKAAGYRTTLVNPSHLTLLAEKI